MAASPFPCPACGAVLQASNAAPGALLKCPKCPAIFPVPVREPEAPSPVRPPIAVPVTVAPPVAAAQPIPPAVPLAAPVDPPAPAVDWFKEMNVPAESTGFLARLKERWNAIPWVELKDRLRRQPGLAAGLAAAAVVLFGLLVWAVWPSGKETPPGDGKDPKVAAGPNKKDSPEKRPGPAGTAPEKQGPVRPSLADPPSGPPPTFDNALQDVEVAKRQAGREKKDLLIVFHGSDWSSPSMRLADEVLRRPEFHEGATRGFVFVNVDFPHNQPARARVQDPARNQRLQDHYQIETFPQVVLADAEGRPYAVEGSLEGGANKYLSRLTTLQRIRVRRDEFFGRVEAATGVAKLAAAREALAFLQDADVLGFYEPLVESWSRLAAEYDSRNEQGYAELFFEGDWFIRLSRLDREDEAEVTEVVAMLERWEKMYRFKDGNRGARLHLLAAALLAQVDQQEAAMSHVKAGQAYKPSDKKLAERLDRIASGFTLSSGTGFVVGTNGHILTNHHVIGGKGRVLVRLPGVKEPVPAEVIARDKERDIALIRIEVPAGVTLAPIPVTGERLVGRGERVAAFGYPLGEAVGSGLKLTTGVVSGTPERGTSNMLVLDAKVNPGNSGGPLCDSFGNVIGMVTAKSIASGNIESYGMAVPAPELDGFLKKHLPDYQPAAARARSLQWDEVDRLVSPAVLMVLKAL